MLARLQKFQKTLDSPPKHVIEENIAGEKFYHLPISYVEHMLKKIFFGLYQPTIVSYSIMVNEVIVHARVTVFHPIIGTWMHYDGIGAIPITQDSQTKVADFIQHKKKKAIAMNIPNAYAIAIKNACKKIGKVFGGDLNRKHEDTYHEYQIDNTPLND